MRDEAVRCIVLGGSERAFAAGADIGELASASPMDMYHARRIERWDAIRKLRTPLVAAVSGFCLGGGCELAMACDLIVASETARFGQPETGLGIIPGAGGTQRLARAVGKAKAMDVVLSGRFLDAHEAERAGSRRPRRRPRGLARGGEAASRARSLPRARSRSGWRRSPSTARSSRRSRPGSTSSARRSTSRSPPRTRARASTAFTEKRKPDFRGR